MSLVDDPDSLSPLERLWQLANQLQAHDGGSLTRERLDSLRRLIAAARQSELAQQRHLNLIDQTLDAIFIVDRDHRLTDVNSRAGELLGYARHELLRLPLRALLPAEEWNSFLLQLQSGPTSTRERRMLRRDASPVLVELRLSWLADGGYQAVVRDITERRQLEDSRRENERRLQAIVGSMDDVMLEMDADGTYIDVQTRNTALLRYPPDELIGRTVDEVFEPEVARSILEAIRRALNTGHLQALEFPVRWPDKTLWFLARVTPAPAANSFVKTVVLLARDITERKQAEQVLAQNAAEIAALYRASTQLLIPAENVAVLAQHIARSVTREFNFVACSVLLVNDAGDALQRVATVGEFSFDPDFALPLTGPGLTVEAFKTRTTIYAPDVRADARYFSGNPATRLELAVPMIVGERVIGVLDLQSPELDAFTGRAQHIVEVFAEQAALAIDNARLVENLERARAAAEEANQLKSMFLANTSHELRTPLAVIMGALDAVLNNLCLPEERPQLLHTAHMASQRLQFLINDLLDYAKIEAGHLDLNFAAVDVLPLLADAYMFIRPQAEKKQLHLEMRLPPEPPPLIWADANKVEQILLNLLGNAVKFTEHGGVTVSLETDWEEPRCLQITVQDTGIGIPPEKQAELFQPFVQVDGSTTRRYGGTGLGLSLSRRLAEMMGGLLTLYSEGEGHGSKFTLRLPLAHQTST